MTDDATLRFHADRGDARQRLDRVLLRHVTDVSRLSRALVQRWIDAGAVRVDGAIVRRGSSRVPEGAEVMVAIPDGTTRRERPRGEALPLDIVHEDTSLIVLNKPAGIVVHPSYRQTTGTVLNGVLWRLRSHPDARPGILTRLDKDTSGLVIVTLDPGAHATMQRDAAAGHVRKEYLAITGALPRPDRGRIIDPLGRDPHDRRRIVVTPGGASSETRYEVLEVMEEAITGEACPRSIALVRCEPVTGRTHQIRVHLASRGWPILGDRAYGTPHPLLSRQALHAWRVRMLHPASRETLSLVAPLPADMRAFAFGDPRA
jgi:23S rRNA pseudouridine1911/1915/1917 synthase